MAVKSATATLTAAGSTNPFPLTQPISAGLLPSCLVALSAGASLTYTVEVTGDNIQAPNYLPANGNWFPMDNMAALSVSANGTLKGAVTAVRATITAYTSGTLDFAFCWAQ